MTHSPSESTELKKKILLAMDIIDLDWDDPFWYDIRMNLLDLIDTQVREAVEIWLDEQPVGTTLFKSTATSWNVKVNDETLLFPESPKQVIKFLKDIGKSNG